MTRTSRALWERARRRNPRRFPTFEAAAAETTGYEAADIVDTVARKTKALRASPPIRVCARQTAQDLLVLHRVGQGTPLHVLDIGGACGGTFFELDALAPGLIGRWQVVDTPAMTDRARESFSTDRLTFTADVAEGLSRKPDVVMAKGVLQYTSDPIAFLSEMATNDASGVYLSRTPAFVDTGAPSFIQQTTRLKDHGPGSIEAINDRPVTVAATVLPWISYTKAMRGEVVWEFDEGNAWKLAGRTIRDMGILVRLR